MTLAVVGATGAVGRVLLQVVPTRAVVWDRVKLAASAILHFISNYISGKCLSIDSIRIHGIIGIHYGNDSRMT